MNTFYKFLQNLFGRIKNHKMSELSKWVVVYSSHTTISNEHENEKYLYISTELRLAFSFIWI